ncbi:MAG: tail protein X [Caulobacter sp.]|nr:tail protein X [Caulobacter sp.]
MTVRAIDGDTLDALVWREAGKGSDAIEAVLLANRGLADLGPVLPRGTLVVIPASAQAIQADAALINLWD